MKKHNIEKSKLHYILTQLLQAMGLRQGVLKQAFEGWSV
jgi:hypothetical protein